MSDLTAVVLAAGLGTRMKSSLPKLLHRVAGRALVEYPVRAALSLGAARVVVVTSPNAELKAFFERTFGDRVVSVVQDPPRGTGDAVRSCQGRLRGGSFLVLNGDDLYGAKDLAELARHPAGLLVRPVNDPERWGIATLRPDGTLEKLVEKPKGLPAPQLANAGAYVFPEHVFETELTLSPRNEYEVTQYVSALAARGTVWPVRCDFWLPIGDVAAWQAAQEAELERVMAGR